MTDLHGNEPIVFDDETAELLVSSARNAATTLTGQRGTRSSAVTKAKEDFAGLFADLFSENALTASSDASQLATALEGLSEITSGLIDAARAEDERRRVAREWYEERENRSNVEKFGDWLGGEEDPPSGPQPPPPVEPAAVPPNRERPQTGGGGGGSTSSARPENLRSFATTTSGADDEASPHRVRVTNQAGVG